MNDMNNEQYKKYAEKIAPNSKIGMNILKAFLIGGLICTVGEGIRQLFLYFKYSPDQVAAATSICMIFLGASLTAIGVYDKIGKCGGAGSAIPITGFANAIVSPAIEYKSEGYVMGVGAKMFTIAGPVLVYGITSSVVCGFIYYFFM